MYTTLQRLERDGLVESDDPAGDGPQKGFRITAAGGRELAEWLRTPPDTVPPPRDELVIKVLVALPVPGVDVHELVQVHRRHLVELMQQYTHLKAEAAEHDVGLALVVDAELFRLEAVIRWLDAADARLAAGRGRPARSATSADPARRQPAGGAAMTACSSCARCRRSTGRGPAEVQALREVDLTVDAGELVAVMGPSGSGKSTLLTIAGSLEEPTSGEVLVGGSALAGMSRNERARLRRRSIGYVFQDFNLLAGLTAVENVALPLELDGVGQHAARAAGLAALERARPGRPGRPLPRRALGRRAPAGRDRPGGGRRPPPAAGRRADRRPRLGQRRGGDAPAAGRLQARGGRRGRDPRRPAGVVGRPGGVPARRAGGRPDRPAPGPRVAPRAQAEPVSPAASPGGR